MLSHKLQQIKIWLKSTEGDLLVAVSFILIALIGFGLGRLSAFQERTPIQIDYQKPLSSSTFEVENVETEKQEALLVGSKNSDKYHFPWCSGALRIKDENKIYFSSQEEAKKFGYKPASNCEGL